MTRLATPPGFSFSSTVESHGWYQLAPFRWDGRTLLRKEALPEGLQSLSIAHDGKALVIRGAKASDELTRRMTRMFQLHVDTSEFVALTRSSPRHAWVEPAGFGRLLCGSTLWEDAVKVIMTTNTMWRQTRRMAELFVEVCGIGGAFPSQADVLRFTPDELQERCRLGYRAKSIHALAQCDLSGVVAEGASSEEQFRHYTKLPGIGPYGAAHLLAMDGRHDFIAVDTEFRRHVRETYHGGRNVKEATMVRRYAKWGKWKYLAYWADHWGSVR